MCNSSRDAGTIVLGGWVTGCGKSSKGLSDNKITANGWGDTTMAEHKHGTMDTRVQEKTFEDFMKITARAVGVILVLLVILAIFGA